MDDDQLNPGLSPAPAPRWRSEDVRRPIMLVLGVIIILLSPLVGLLPGPGGVFVFAFGLALVLRSSRKSRKLHAQIRRKYPRYAQFTDFGLGRWKKSRARKIAARERQERQDQN